MRLEDSIVYGPVLSRRYGWDLGINLLPLDRKLCAFDCVYCQYGFTPSLRNTRYKFPTCNEVISAWRQQILDTPRPIYHTTVSGNGEPTMHPHFAEIAEGMLKWRDRNIPIMRVALFTTGYHCGDPKIRNAMELFDEAVVKFDSAIPEKWQKINRPIVPLTFEEFKNNLRKMKKFTLQTMFIRNWNDGEEDVRAWKQAIEELRPAGIQVYTISRRPALTSLEPVDNEWLHTLEEWAGSANSPLPISG